jgi:hypothetical protein
VTIVYIDVGADQNEHTSHKRNETMDEEKQRKVRQCKAQWRKVKINNYNEIQEPQTQQKQRGGNAVAGGWGGREKKRSSVRRRRCSGCSKGGLPVSGLRGGQGELRALSGGLPDDRYPRGNSG